MKKKIIITILTVLILSILSVTAFAFTTGDVTGDGKLTAADARLALRYSAKLETLSEEHIKAADVDNSGKVTASDARKILRVCAKLDPPFEGIDIDEYLIEKGVLHVAVPKDNKPFAYEENGKLKGTDVTMMQEFADRMNLELKLHPMTYDECLDAVKNGKCDMVTSVDGSLTPDGFAPLKVYFHIRLNAIVSQNSSYEHISQIKNASSLKIGVLDNETEKRITEELAGKSQIKTYKTCKDAVAALKKGSVDVFVTNFEYARTTASWHNTVRIIDDGDYFECWNSVAVAEDKAAILDKAGAYINLSETEGYEKNDDTTKVFCSQNNITIAPGGTAVIEVSAESFYIENPEVGISFNHCLCNYDFFTVGDRTFVFVTTNSNLSKNGKFSVISNSGRSLSEVWVNVTISPNGPKYYQYFDNTKIPDFGAYTGTARWQTEIDTDNKVIVHTYDAGELYNNGITDSSQIDAYLDMIEAAGYAYMGYQEMGNTVSLVFGNEKTEKYVTYVEVYDEEGYLVAIGIGYEIPDFML